MLLYQFDCNDLVLNWIRRLDNNSLSGAIPASLANMTQLAFL